MGLWDKVVAGAKKAKLQGDLTLLDREITNRKYALGIELYECLTADTKPVGGGIMAVTKNIRVAQLQQNTELNDPFEACRADIRDLEAQQEGHRQSQEALQTSRMRGVPPTTVGENLAHAGQWISTNATEAKLEGQIRLLDRDIRRRQEVFGVQVYDSYLATAAFSTPGDTTSMRERLAARMTQYSPKEKKVQECLDRSKSAIALLERERMRKLKEMEELDDILQGTGTSAGF